MKPRFATALAPLAATAALTLAPLATAHALPLNGDFADSLDLADWTATGADVGEPTGDFAQLDTNGDFQRTLEQTFSLPSGASILSFDFAFSNDATQVPGGVFPNVFTVFLDGLGGTLDILAVDLLGATPDLSDGNELSLGVLPIDVTLDPAVTIPGFIPIAGGASYSGRVSLLLPAAVLGQDATLYFDLYDYGYGASTIAAVDNVTIEPANAVPVPATFGLLLIGLAATSAIRRKQS
jgi:hypothetical protein